MKKKVWIAIGVSILIIGMVGISVYRQAFAKGPDVETAEVKTEELSSTLMIPGTLNLESKQEVYYSPEKGEVKEILVSVGQQVKQGDVLAKLENQQLELEVEQNKLAIESSYLKINGLKKQKEKLNEQKKELSKEIGEKEAEKQLSSEFDQVELEQKTADLDLRQTLLQKELLAKQAAELEIKSTIDGVVLSVEQPTSLSAAEAANVHGPMILVGNMGGMVATGALSEYDTLKVSIGQKVKLTSDAVPDQQWEGEIIQIGTLPKENNVSATGESQAVQYPVKVKVTSSEMNLKPGFQLIMEIETDKKQGLTIPVDALMGEGDESFVYQLEGKKAKRTEVKVGITSGEKVEIVKGLKSGNEVILSPSEGITDGMEVTKK
jgi:HlyD family secretion protein